VFTLVFRKVVGGGHPINIVLAGAVFATGVGLLPDRAKTRSAN
jgi:hypothetical protein